MIKNIKDIISGIITMFMFVGATGITEPGKLDKYVNALVLAYESRGAMHALIELGLGAIVVGILFIVVWTAVYYVLLELEEMYNLFMNSEED